ncbi:putative inorganic phosphate cotransporter [Anastrepha obliqua]|uniref:putative inorganic phosphate cotransporter n=1 Tax=Anastrepha obliqua TaxID=95512 RepID=UPI0024097020|nr:putative inorganic phosphate cotransporter [Anastrepha obliqua]
MSNTERRGFNKIRDMLSCRQVLNLLTMLGFMLNYALRVNLTIAIVAMVHRDAHSPPRNSSAANAIQKYDNGTVISTTTSTTTQLPPVDDNNDYFPWNSYQTNFVLGSFFWGYILTELPGGRLAELIGGRRVFGHSMLWASVLTLVTPLAAHINYIMLIIVRVLLGFMLGASWPAIHPVAAVWIPPMERSKFMSNMMASSLGAAITMPVCGFFISIWGWPSVFYLTGGVGLLWSICWFTFVYETPATHPRITSEERREIEDAIGTSTSKTRPSYVPWRDLFSSGPVWAIIITHGLSVFGFFTVINQLPTFMDQILLFNIKQNGLFSSLPYLGKYIMALSSSCFADYLRQRGTLSTTATRKVFTGFALLSPGTLMIAQIFLGRDAAWSVTIFTLALFTHGAVTAGYLGNGLDIAPNFSGTIFGLANTLSSFGGYVSTWMVGTLTYENESYHQWQIVFGILAGTYISSAIVYIIMGSGELQPWNNPPERKRRSVANAEEGEPLKNEKLHVLEKAEKALI